MARLGHGVSARSVRTLNTVRRGASFEAWLRDRGIAAEVAEEWAGHAVWVTGYAAGRWGKVLFDVTPAELEELAAGGWVDWAQVGPAVSAWFDWLRGEPDVPHPTSDVRHPSATPRLRLVEGGSP